MKTELSSEDKKNIKKAIIRSQHCQRNWDLSKKIPQEDLDLILLSATQCPSKQNAAHYRVHAVTDRDLIEEIHEATGGFTYRDTPDGPRADVKYGEDDTEIKYETNTQVLANLLIVLEDYTDLTLWETKRNQELYDVANGKSTHIKEQVLRFDRNVAVGVAAGYLNMTASMLGYQTGCCTCMTHDKVKDIMGLRGTPLLLMGIGYKAPNKNRRIHHNREDFLFPTKSKQEIPVFIHD